MEDIYKISPEAEVYLHEDLYQVIHYYLVGGDFQRQADSFRGSLTMSFNLGYIGYHSFIFLINFLVWLESRSDFNPDDDAKFTYFLQGLIEEMESHFYG